VTTDSDLRQLLDKQAITDRLLDYARGVDLIDTDLIASVFHDDANLDYGTMFNGTGAEFADFIAAVHPTMETTSHHLSNVTVTVDGDHAGSETYVIMLGRMKSPDGDLSDTLSRGRYLDQWQRRDGQWRVSSRQYLHSADDTRPVGSAGFPVLGSRDLTDPSYAVLRGTR
jgi:ketosteroid isomerase-like protein